MRGRTLVFRGGPLAVAVLAAVLVPVSGAAERKARLAAEAATNRVVTIHYRAHDGRRRAAVVLLPSWYGPANNPAIPLVISPHGRGLSGRKNAALWGRLPTEGTFAVVNPDATGRRLPRYSWGYRGQVDDLARMPEIVRRTIPWLRVDRSRVYAFGGSMGGQETLLLVARYPRLLAGAAAFDSVTDFVGQYRRFPRLACKAACKRAWAGSLGAGLQKLARDEVGGSPKRRLAAWKARSPITYVQRIARSCVPLQIWWSVSDRVVTEQRLQSGRLFWQVRAINPHAPISAHVGFWIHTAEMRADRLLPRALATFGLMHEHDDDPRYRLRVNPAPRPGGRCADPSQTPIPAPPSADPLPPLEPAPPSAPADPVEAPADVAGS